jgi:hypothetical protein
VTALYRDAPELAYVLRKGGKLRGYLLGRRGDDRLQIGPCIVHPDRASHAKDLFSAFILDNTGWNVRACVPGPNSRARSLVEGFGLSHVASATRMYQGETFAEAPSVYAIMSAEKG